MTAHRTKGYEPETPISVSPLFDWPPRPAAMAWYLVVPTLIPYGALWIGLAVLCWNVFTPSFDTMSSFEIGWISLLWIRNAALLLAVAGGLHYWLYMRRSQRMDFKYNLRWQSTSNRSFLWTNQVRDNMAWSIASGVTVWTAYESVTYWLYANEHIRSVSWDDAPIYIAAMTVLTFAWSTFHFYANHRLLHTEWLYSVAHSLHHKNVNTGPWSGISMHPLEHVIYFSVAALYWIVPVHPVVPLTVLLFSGLSPSVSHSGFEEVRVRRDRTVGAGDYFHHLHHKYFECNYGNRLVPLDKLVGTFHDGTTESHQRMLERRKNFAAR